MKFLLGLLLACWASTGALAVLTCKTNSRGHLIPFNGRPIEAFFPCKFYALKQQECGKYIITLSPGHLWLGDNYYVNSAWMGIKDKDTGLEWDARTTNKLAVKSYKSNGTRNLFNFKGTPPPIDGVFEWGAGGEAQPSAFMKAADDSFKFTFYPWDPNNRRKFPHPNFVFECFRDDAPLNEYPIQMCGGLKKTVKERATAGRKKDEEEPKDPFKLEDRFARIVPYYDNFMSDVEQTDEQCIEAAAIFQNDCKTFEQRLLVMKNCHEILWNIKRATIPVTLYTCSPMDAFNACLKWGCAEKPFDTKEKDLCEVLGQTIDLCPPIAGAGNITERMRAANCFKDWAPGLQID